MIKLAFTLHGYKLIISDELTGYSFKLLNPQGKQEAYLLRDSVDEATKAGLLYLKNLLYDMISAVDFKLKEFK